MYVLLHSACVPHSDRKQVVLLLRLGCRHSLHDLRWLVELLAVCKIVTFRVMVEWDTVSQAV